MQERRIDQAQEIGRLAGIIESMQNSSADGRREILDYVKKIDARTEGISTILAEHVREDSVMRGDVDDLQEWRDGKNGKKGAQDHIEEYLASKYKKIGAMAVMAAIGGILGPVLAKAFGM